MPCLEGNDIRIYTIGYCLYEIMILSLHHRFKLELWYQDLQALFSY